MTVESAWPSDCARALNALEDADHKIRLVLKSHPKGKIAALLEVASQNLAEAAALIERGE